MGRDGAPPLIHFLWRGHPHRLGGLVFRLTGGSKQKARARYRNRYRYRGDAAGIPARETGWPAIRTGNGDGQAPDRAGIDPDPDPDFPDPDFWISISTRPNFDRTAAGERGQEDWALSRIFSHRGHRVDREDLLYAIAARRPTWPSKIKLEMTAGASVFSVISVVSPSGPWRPLRWPNRVLRRPRCGGRSANRARFCRWPTPAKVASTSRGMKVMVPQLAAPRSLRCWTS